jgi:hypothetical protein
VKLFFNVDSIGGFSTAGAVWQAAGILVNGVPLSMSQVLKQDVQSVINYPPKDPEAFVDYAADLARRYPQIQSWEVWNEPNTSFFWRPAVDVEAYTNLLKKTYQVLKGVNPTAKVVLGGLSPGNSAGRADAASAPDFLGQIYERGCGAFFDAVTYHAYGDGPPESWLANTLLELRKVMDSHGDISKPIWITEIGFYTFGSGSVTEQSQAEYLHQARTVLKRLPFVVTARV